MKTFRQIAKGHILAAIATGPEAHPAAGGGLDREAVARIIRERVKVDATGLSPAVASAFVIGIEDAADAIIALTATEAKPDADKLRIAVEALERGIKRCETYEHIRLGGRTETAKKAGTLRNAMSDMRQALAALKAEGVK